MVIITGFVTVQKVSCTCCTHVLKNFLVNNVTYNLLPEVTVFVILAFLALAVQVEILAVKLIFVNCT